jgi:competence protein ComFC
MEAAKSKGVLKLLANSINNLLWPAVCINCRATIANNNDKLCNNCWSELLACTTDSCCLRCGKDVSIGGLVNGICPACQGQNFHFDAIVGCGTYDKTLKNMILAFKHSHCELAAILGRLADTALQNSGFGDKFDYLVPVPLHWKRRLARGYNQALLIAGQLCTAETKLNTDLIRIRNTVAQPDMASPAARARNVADAFAVRKGHSFAGKSVCLVDDVKTTGATLNECARTLKQAGAEKVYALVLAVAGQNTG